MTSLEHKVRMLEYAGKTFNLRKEAACKWAKAVGLPIKTAGTPQQGPFYWVNLGGKQVLKSMPFPTDMDDTMDHPDFWADIVRSQIAPFYGISDRGIVDELVEVPYAMPRGRVAFMQRPLEGTKKFVIYHGDMMTDEQKKQVLSAFNLNEVFHAGLARFSNDEHENSIPYDTDRFSELIKSAKKPAKPIGKPRQPPR